MRIDEYDKNMEEKKKDRGLSDRNLKGYLNTAKQRKEEQSDAEWQEEIFKFELIHKYLKIIYFRKIMSKRNV